MTNMFNNLKLTEYPQQSNTNTYMGNINPLNQIGGNPMQTYMTPQSQSYGSGGMNMGGMNMGGMYPNQNFDYYNRNPYNTYDRNMEMQGGYIPDPNYIQPE